MTILIGYKPTPRGEAAFEAGLVEAAARGEEAVVLNSPRRGGRTAAGLLDADASQALVDRGREAGVTVRVDHADHGDELVDVFNEAVERTGARLVVIGLKRRSPVGKLVMGSSAQRLLLECEAPILAVKPPR